MTFSGKHICFLFSWLLALQSIIVRAQQQTGLANFRQQCNTLLAEGGKWKSLNSDYNPADSSSPAYFGYTFSKGINANTLHLRVSGYLPVQAEWVDYQESVFSWDHVKNKLAYHSVYASGAIASGESDLVSGTEITVTYNLKTPGGKIEKRRDDLKIKSGELLTSSHMQLNGSWKQEHRGTWSRLEQPPGKLAFMSTRDGNFEIYTMDANGDNLRNHSCNKATDYAFSYTPEGKLIFYSNRDGNDEIYVMEPDGKKVTNLTKHPAADRIPYSSPDGKRIAFISNRDDENGEIYVMDADGNNLKRLTSNKYFEDAPTWSPDGRKIYFSRELRDVTDTSDKAVRNMEIFVMDADGSQETRLTNKAGGDGGPQLSPDGTRIAFYGSTEKGNYEIFLMDADGKNIVNLSEDPLEDYSPSWSPDGKWIAYTKGNSKNYDVWVIQLETKIKYRLTTQPRRDESPFWISVK